MQEAVERTGGSRGAQGNRGRLVTARWLEERGHLAPGQTSKISLPGAANAEAEGERVERHAARKQVLVVDDEMLVRRTLSLFLMRAGFEAVAVDNAAQAMKLLSEDGRAFDLLVTDQSMPGLSGCELIKEAGLMRPAMPVLLVTGYNMAEGTGDVPTGDLHVEQAVRPDDVHQPGAHPARPGARITSGHAVAVHALAKSR